MANDNGGGEFLLNFDSDEIIDLYTKASDEQSEFVEEFDLTEDFADLGADDEVFNLDFDEGVEIKFDTGANGVDDILLTHAPFDIVETLKSYASSISVIRSAIAVENNTDELVPELYVVGNSEFPYMPEDVFRIFHAILVDLAVTPEYAMYDVDRCLELSLELLVNSTSWNPRLYIDAYRDAFTKWFTRFRSFGGVSGTNESGSISSLFDKEQLELAEIIYNVNTEPFAIVNMFLDGIDALEKSSIVSDSMCGPLWEAYRAEHNVRYFTVASAYQIIINYLSSDEFAQTVKIPKGDLSNYSIGELLRRCVQFELLSGIFFPVGVKTNSEPDTFVGTVINCLEIGKGSGSAAAELLGIISCLILSVDSAKTDKLVQQFLEQLYFYFLCYKENPAYINPVFYGYVRGNGDNYILSYANKDKVYEIESPDVLCGVVGNRTVSYCFPSVLLDEDTECAICPPLLLFTSLRGVHSAGRLKITGHIKFVFKPTIGWLLQNKLLASDVNTVDEGSALSLERGDNSLLEALLSYDNDFVTERQVEVPVALASEKDGIVLYCLPRPLEMRGLFVCAGVTIENGQVTPIASSGIAVIDEDSNAIIAQVKSPIGANFDIIINAEDKVQRDFLVVTTVEQNSASYDKFLLGEVEASKMLYTSYTEAAKELCAIASLCYEDELSLVQRILAGDLFYVLRMYSLDTILASRIIQSYQLHCSGNNGVIESNNLSTLKELFDIVFGEPNQLTGVTKWTPECVQILQDLTTDRLFKVGDITSYLKSLNLDVIALQAICVGQSMREPDLQTYYAFRELPGVGSMMRELESSMVAIRVFNIMGSDISKFFSRFKVMSQLFFAEITPQTIDFIHEYLVEKLHKMIDLKDRYTLPTTKYILSHKANSSLVTLKYLILERNAYNLLNALGNYPELFDLRSKMLKQVDIESGAQLSSMSESEFNSRVSRAERDKLFVNNFSELMKIIEGGVISEVLLESRFDIVKAFDLFKLFHSLFFRTSEASMTPVEIPVVDRKNLLAYAGSMIISYCPVKDNAANEIDGGSNRAMVFLNNRSDFIYNADLSWVSDYELSDMRTIVGGE